MLTNVSHKPVVTWKDLRNGFGYRLPYGINNKVNDYGTSFLLKGVTYKDLENCAKGYISEYKSQFDQLTDAQKRMYITNKATLSTFVYPISSFSLTPASKVGYYTTSVGYTGGTQFRFVADPMSEMKDIVWFTFTADQSLAGCSVTWDNLSLVATYTSAGPVNASITLQGQILVRRAGSTLTIGRGMIQANNISTDNTYEPIDVQMPTTLENIQKGVTYEVVLSVYTSVFYRGELDVPSLTAEFPLKPITPGVTTTTITFYSKNATLSLESNNKCVTYDLIKANTNATVPVYVQVKNTYGTYINADYVQFIYHYKLVNGSWTSKTTGEADWDRISANTTVSTTVNVLINPVVGDIEADYLEIYFGRANSDKDMAYAVYSGGTKILSNSGHWASITLRWNEGAYAGAYRDMLTQITDIYYSVD